MIYSGPVSCQFFENSCNLIQPEAVSGVSFIFHLSGEHGVTIGNAVFESKNSFALIVPSNFTVSMNGSGRACHLWCRQSYLNELCSTSFGKKITNILPDYTLPQYRGFQLNLNTKTRVDQVLDNISREISLSRSDYLDMVHINLYELLILLKRNGLMSPEEMKIWSGKQRVWKIEDVIHHVSENFDDSFSLDDLASRCALNSSYFSRAFKEYVGIPLFEYINRLRIDRACHLLKNNDMTILDIAFSVGYNNISFFNRYFKRLKGVSPGEFRRRVHS